MSKPPVETPFPRHWLFYIVLKLAVIIGAIVITLSLYGLI